MSDRGLGTPVAFLIFNRPDTTSQVFERIAAARPPKLLVVADGPRANRAHEAEQCARTRAVVEQVNWPCEVIRNYSDANLGCRRRVASGLDWVFQQVEEAIILEDDCVPHPTFFRFCEDLLERYRNDERVGMISGDNFQFGRHAADGSYYLSKYTHIWGWATWRRAWQHYDVTARYWPQFLASGAFEQATFPGERATWRSALERVHAGQIDTWDYQWTLACWAQSMLCILPEVNMVTNIGFGADATHTQRDSPYANLEARAMSWPLREPSLFAANVAADRATAEGQFSVSVRQRLRARARSLAAGLLSRRRQSAEHGIANPMQLSEKDGQ